MGYRIRKRRELGESQAREETVESTLCRHSRYRSVVPPPYPTQSCSTAKCEGREREGGREGRGCRTVVTSPSGEGRSRDALLQLPTEPLCTDKTRVPRIQRAVRERVKEAIRDNRFPVTALSPLYCCYYYYFISIAGILSVAFRRGNSTTSQSVLRLRIQEGSITWRSRMQLCKNTNIRGFLLHGL